VDERLKIRRRKISFMRSSGREITKRKSLHIRALIAEIRMHAQFIAAPKRQDMHLGK
jgi:hypothetical protein